MHLPVGVRLEIGRLLVPRDLRPTNSLRFRHLGNIFPGHSSQSCQANEKCVGKRIVQKIMYSGRHGHP